MKYLKVCIVTWLTYAEHKAMAYDDMSEVAMTTSEVVVGQIQVLCKVYTNLTIKTDRHPIPII